MTGLGEEVYEDRSAALDALVAESERIGLYGTELYNDHIGGVTEMVEKASRTLAERHWIDKTAMGAHRPVAMAEYSGRTWRCFSEDARAALESLGIPLTVLAAIRSGEWVAVPRNATLEMKIDGQWSGYHAEEGEEIDAMWWAMIAAAPKSPSEEG